ncbi:MAG: ribosome-associated translation inhibitor RaiA [Gammaproteobacteria bacterium]|nr:ribosome-associated translation inhibitor RaiA [Gammaproteobacteria bacterium]
MNMSLAGHHVEITDAMRAYVTEKLAKVERHVDHITSTSVVLSVEKNRQRAEATIQVPGGTLFADSTKEDMYAAIDELSDRLDRQALKHKEKQKDHHRREKEILDS